MLSLLVLILAAYSAPVASIDPCQVQGSKWIAEKDGQVVEGVVGVVTARRDGGFWLLGSRDNDPTTPDGIYIDCPSSVDNCSVDVGRAVAVSGKVQSR